MSASVEPELARVASMIGVPARATMLSALLGGRPMSAGALARAAEVAPSTASQHLSQLTASGLVACHASGRNRYYALANDEVAAALEALSLISTPSAEINPANPQFKFARTCYDHLAGELGVVLAETLIERGFIDRGSGFELTQSGEQWLDSFGIDSSALRRRRRPLVRACLDWSERRHHLAGAVGAAILTVMLDRGWLARIEHTRTLRLTVRGRDGLYRVLGLDLVP